MYDFFYMVSFVSRLIIVLLTFCLFREVVIFVRIKGKKILFADNTKQSWRKTQC